MVEIKKTGGARIGWANATWPFATLKVDKNKIELKANIIGNLVFTPNDVISIEPYGLIPFFGQGIKINHRVNSYNSKVIFWTLDNPKNLIKKIEQIGFLGNSSPVPENIQKEISQTQTKGGFPIKTQVAVSIVLIWNLLFGIDIYKMLTKGLEGSQLGIGAALAICFILITSASLLFSEYARRIILKKGTDIDDIKRFIYFLMFICVLMLLNISVMP